MDAKIVFDKSKFRRAKDSVEVKAIKEVLRKQAKEVVNKVKSNAPRDSGALRYSTGSKVITRRQRVTVIIGARASYSKTVKGIVKTPFRYSPKVEKDFGYLKASVGQTDVDAIRDDIASALREALN